MTTRKRQPKASTKHTIALFLLREEITSATVAVVTDPRITKTKVTIAGHKCDLFIKPSRPHVPRWVKFFGSELDGSKSQLTAQSPSAVLLVPHKKRMFAIAFGHGRHLLKSGVWEERFGLKVTLNAVDPKSIRSIKKQSFDALARVVQEQSARAAHATEFGLDVERDLLRDVVGTPVDPDFAARLSGADALFANVALDAADLPAFLDRCIAYYHSDEYKKEYPWVDHIAAVSTKQIIEKLDEELVLLLRKEETDGVWLAAPDLLDWTGVDGFSFLPKDDVARQPDLHVRDFFASIGGAKNVDIGLLKNRYAHCWSSTSEDHVSHKWSVYKCIYCELEHDDETYLLSNGKWYRVEKDFVADVDKAVDRIPLAKGLSLPDCGDVDESVYNQEVYDSDPMQYALMDRKLIRHGGANSQIEVCDLLTKDRRLIHIKKYGGSSVLSHLFAQAAVSGELLFMDDEFRAKANNGVPTTHRFPTPMVAREFEVVLGVISWATKRKLKLPFFSRVNLRAASRRLQGFGYKVSIATIKGPSAPKP